MIDITSIINTNAAHLQGVAGSNYFLPFTTSAAQMVAQKAGFNLSAEQLEELGGVIVIVTRYAHLEAPKIKAGIIACGRAAYRAGQWIAEHGGVFGICSAVLCGHKPENIVNEAIAASYGKPQPTKVFDVPAAPVKAEPAFNGNSGPVSTATAHLQ